MYEKTLVMRDKSEYLIAKFDNGAKEHDRNFGMKMMMFKKRFLKTETLMKVMGSE